MSLSPSNLITLFAPSPCPFCGAELMLEEDDEGMYYMHPGNSCIMASVILDNLDEIKLWQVRVVGQHAEGSGR